MLDHNQARLAAIWDIYPHSQVFLCIWHVLHTMQCHFVTSTFKLLWEKIQLCVKTGDPAKFSKIWEEVSTDPLAPQSLMQYLKTEWLPVCERWSKVSRQNWHIFEEGDTNMFIEAYVILSVQCSVSYLTKMAISRYHHVLKSGFLDGKYNQHFDYLMFTLLPIWHEKQQAGLDSLNLEASHHIVIEQIVEKITQDSIEKFDDIQFHIASQTESGQFYSIDLVQPTCSCPDFLHIWFCKHISVIYFYFPHVHPSHTPIAPPAPSVLEHMPVQSMSSNTFHSLVQDVNILLHQLISDQTNDLSLLLAVVEAICSAKACLTMVIALVNGSSPLPTKEKILPNQPL
jgi:hypothetical protein